MPHSSIETVSGGSKGGGGATGARPPKIGSTIIFFIQFFYQNA